MDLNFDHHGSGTSNQWVERIDPAQISPPDIYWAQMKVLHGITPAFIDPATGHSGIRSAAGKASEAAPGSIPFRSRHAFMEVAGRRRSDYGNWEGYDFSGRALPIPR